MNNFFKKISCVFGVLLLFFVTTPLTTAFADTQTVVDFSKTNVMNDLIEAEKNGSLNTIDLMFEEKGCVCYFVEYGFAQDDKSLFDKYFGLYVYFYNPSMRKINIDSSLNKVQMATKRDSNGKITDYEKYPLKFCSKTDDDKYYKFKIDKIFDYEYFKTNGRYYSISGIELCFNKSLNAEEFNVGGEYSFTGYAKGFGRDINAGSTLKFEKKDLLTLTLDVHHTFYRGDTTPASFDRFDIQKQVDSVYFSVPNNILEKYGKLQRVKAEWYEFKTKPILLAYNGQCKIPGNLTPYQLLTPCIGKPYNYDKQNFGNPAMEGFFVGDRSSITIDGATFTSTACYYGGKNNHSGNITSELGTFSALFSYKDSSFDPYATKNADSNTNELYDYILNNKSGFTPGTYLDIKNGRQLLSVYFEDDIDDTRKLDDEHGHVGMGKSYYDFDADISLGDIYTYVPESHSFFDNVGQFGFWNTLFNKIPTETKTIYPITRLDNKTFMQSLDNAALDELSNTYCIDKSQLSDVIDYVQNSANNQETTFLFNFSVSDYYSRVLNFYTYNFFDINRGERVYAAQQSVFFDFDIIQLGFKGDAQELTIIPTVSNPIDIVNPLTPPKNFGKYNIDWDGVIKLIEAILGVIVLCALLYFCQPILPYVLDFVVFLVKLPIMLISSIIKSFKK